MFSELSYFSECTPVKMPRKKRHLSPNSKNNDKYILAWIYGMANVVWPVEAVENGGVYCHCDNMT